MVKTYLKVRERSFLFGGEKIVIDGENFYLKYNGDKDMAYKLAKNIIGRHRESGLKDKLNLSTKSW